MAEGPTPRRDADQGGITTLRVDVDDSLPDVLTRLRAVKGQPVMLDIPPGSSLLLTATEFRTLREVTIREQIDLSIRTKDRLRVQLAQMLGLGISADPSAPRRARPAERAGAPPDGRRIGHPPGQVARPDGGRVVPLPTAEEGLPDLPEWEEERVSSLDRLRELPPRTMALIAGGVAVAILVAAVAILVFVPRATVAITLQEQTVTTELPYRVIAAGAADGGEGEATFTIQAEPRTQDVTFQTSMPTTGTRAAPDQPASGTVQLANSNSEPVTIAQGTTISSGTGVEYVFTEAVEVPPFDSAAGAAGTADATVQASEPGSIGNIEAGFLSGRLDNEIFYSNRNAPISGGTDRTISVASDADLTALQEQVEADLPALAAAAFAEQLPPDQALVAPSIQTGEPRFTFSHQPDQETDTLTITAVVPSTALAYSRAEVEQQAEGLVREQLAAAVPEGYTLDESSITLGEPRLVTEAPEGAQLALPAQANARAALSDDEREELADDLAGRDAAAARALLDAAPTIAAYEISYSPGWLPDRMPRLSGRITITAEANAAAAPGDPVVATPTAS